MTCPSDVDPPAVCRVERRRARRDYRCCECRRTIARGQRHEYVWGVWDGEPDSYRTCLGCAAARDHIADADGYIYGQLRESIGEWLRDRGWRPAWARRREGLGRVLPEVVDACRELYRVRREAEGTVAP